MFFGAKESGIKKCLRQKTRARTLGGGFPPHIKIAQSKNLARASSCICLRQISTGRHAPCNFLFCLCSSPCGSPLPPSPLLSAMGKCYRDSLANLRSRETRKGKRTAPKVGLCLFGRAPPLFPANKKQKKQTAERKKAGAQTRAGFLADSANKKGLHLVG